MMEIVVGHRNPDPIVHGVDRLGDAPERFGVVVLNGQPVLDGRREPLEVVTEALAGGLASLSP